MEIITEFTNNPIAIYIPVALALLGVVLVFTFGFKPPEQPPFDKLTIDDRKPAGKKRKIKEKVSELSLVNIMPEKCTGKSAILCLTYNIVDWLNDC